MRRNVVSVVIGLIIVALVTFFGNVCKIEEVEVAFKKEPVSADAVEIFENTDINLGDSILSLNENVVKRNVNESYVDNSIAVTDIVRVFPNKIIIYCTEHVPTCAVAKKGEPNVYAIADVDFQLNKVVNKEDLDLSSLILIEGVEVDDTYNTPSFRLIRETLQILQEEGLDNVALVELIEKITLDESSIILYTRDGYRLTCSYGSVDLSSSLKNAYSTYLNQTNS